MAEPEAVAPADPVLVHTVHELAVCLDALRTRRKLSYEAMEKAAGDLRRQQREGRYEHLGKSTVGEIVRGHRLPTVGKLRTFLAVCEVARADQVQWLAAWERARMAEAARPDHAVRVRDARPRHIGVRAAIRVPGASGELPTYVPRDVDDGDDGLRAELTAGKTSGCFVVLVGGSSVGKTRTLYEAVLAVMPGWWLLQPADAHEANSFGAAPIPHTVIWLDELQRYLGDESDESGVSASSVRVLLRAGVVVVGTLGSDEYTTRTAPRHLGVKDDRQRDRELLDMARVIDVADSFTKVENQRAHEAAKADARIRVALDSTDGGLTQVLAAGPAMVRRWEQAPDPYSRAVLTVAIDARRVHVACPLTADVIAEAVPGYLTPAQRATAPPGWLQRALDYAMTPLHGAAAALSPVSETTMGQPSGYLVADFLFQHARQVRRTSLIPTTAWHSLGGYVTDVGDMYGVADSAYQRGLYCYAEPVYQRIVEGRPWWATAAERLTEMWERQGRVDEAATLLWSLVHDYDAAHALAGVLGAHGRVDEAIAVLRPWVHAEVEGRYAAWALADLYAKHGRDEEALELLRGLFLDCDDDPARHSYALRIRLITKLGYLDELRALALDDDDDDAGQQLADILVDRGDVDGAVNFLRELIHARDLKYSDREWAVDMHARLLLDDGHVEDVFELDDLDLSPSTEFIIRWYVNHGMRDIANEWLDIVRRSADAGSVCSLYKLCGLLAYLGEFDELYTRAQAGDTYAATTLATAVRSARHDAATAAFLRCHGTAVLLELADLLGRRNHLDEGVAVVKRYLQTAEAPESTENTLTLRDFVERHCDLDKLRSEADADGSAAAYELTRLLLAVRDTSGLRAEVRAGTEWALDLLIEGLVADGRHDEADQVRRFGFSVDE